MPQSASAFDARSRYDTCATLDNLKGETWARRTLPQGAGAILLTVASARAKGYPQSAVVPTGKIALRGLAQSMTRELARKGIHVAHFVIDGGVRNVEKERVEGRNVAADS